MRTLLQPARAQCLRLSERFFIFICYAKITAAQIIYLFMIHRPASRLH